MKLIRCFFCENTTSIQIINSQKKINGKIVTIMNAPVYYCTTCKETFLSKEVQDVFNYIKQNGLENKSLIFKYEEVSKRLQNRY